jgi:hypothetical protein
MAEFTFAVDESVMPDVKQGTRTSEPKVVETVWKEYTDKTKEMLKASINQAGERFGTAGAPPKPYEKEGKNYKAAPMWAVVGDRSEGVDEEVNISLKCGARDKLAIFPKYKRKKVDGVWARVPDEGVAANLRVKSSEVEGQLKNLLKMVEGMKRGDGGLGDMFHERALKITTKAREKSIENGKTRYNADTDKWEDLS